MDLHQIYEGWKNKLFPSKELKEIIKRVSDERLTVCNGCESHSKNHKTFRPDDHCVICGCTLSAKTACLSCSCPVYKWREIMTSEQEEEMTQDEEEQNNNKEDRS